MRSIFKIILFIPWCILFSIGTQFLSIPSNGIELSTGSNMVLENSLNPASLSMDKNTSLNFSHGNWLADSKVSSLKWTFPNKKSSFGVDLKYASLGDLELRTERPTDDHLAYYNASGFSLGGLYSKEFDRFNAGAAIRFVRIDLYTENSTGIAIDLGTKYHLSRSTVLGAAIMNIGKMSELKNETPALPMRLLMTGTYTIEGENMTNEISITGEWSQLSQGGVGYVSTSAGWNGLIVRLGSKLSKDVLEIRGGFGFSFGMYRLNYGISYGSQDLGLPHMIDLSIVLP